MTYLPLARKYRPQTFADLIGQSTVTTTLTRALKSRRLAQAYLFTGQRGVGKTSAARILAKCLNCEQGPTPTPCNRCPACVQITQGNSLDVLEIDGASNRGIDEIRGLRETVPFAPTSGSYRVYIIDEVHMLTTEAFNALLKTLEEPPAHVKFIFATTAPHKIPATILSRCQRFDFRRIEAGAMVELLKGIAKAERLQVEEPALYAIARAAEGSVRDAEAVLEQAASFVDGSICEADVTTLLGAVGSDALMMWAEAILERNTPEALTILFQQLEQGKDPLQLLTGLLRYLRNLLILRSTEEAASRDMILARLIDEPADRRARLEAQAQHLSAQELLLALQILTGAYELVRRSPMAQTILELVVIKLSTREQWQSLDAITTRLEQLSVGTPPATAASAVREAQAAAPSPTPPAPAAPQPAAAATVSEDLTAVWPVFLERLGAQKMSLAAYLADSRPLSREHGTLTVGLPGFALHQEVLSVVENRRLISRLLSELCQAPITVQYATLAEPITPTDTGAGRPAAPAVSPLVQDIVSLFNATLLDQPPRAAV